MEKQGIKWQIVLGVSLLILLVSSLFLPVFKITGDSYISMAMKVNSYAENQNLDAAKKAGAKKITDKYQNNTTARKEKAEEFDKEIAKASDRISGLQFIRWTFSSGKNIDFPGVTYIEKKDINKSGVKTVFSMMGVLLLVPSAVGICNLIFMLVRRKTYSVWLGITGAVEVICQLLFCKVMPGMIWSKLSSYIKSFTMIDEKTLLIKGTGRYAIKSMVSEFMSGGIYVGFVSGALLFLAAVLFITVWKPAPVSFHSEGKEELLPEKWNFNQNVSPVQKEGAVSSIKWKGILVGVKGEYKGCEIEIQEGEEIILGREPKYCDLIFSDKRVSRKHCGIRYDGNKRTYQVIDYSFNGTMFSDGTAAKAGVYSSVPSGTVLYLAGGAERIQLGKRRYGDAADRHM